MGKAVGYRPEAIRNIVLLGHGGAGKTTLAEAILHRCGAISRMGSIEELSTVSDFEPEAKQHQHSTNSTLLFATSGQTELNVIDTPGHPEFVGYALAALPAVETAVIVVNASTGIEHNTRRLFSAAGEAGLARMIVINKIDTVGVSQLRSLVDELKETFGSRLHCINLPSERGKDVVDCFDAESGIADLFSVRDVHREILESTVEVDDVRLEQYLAGVKIDLSHLRATFVQAMAQGHVIPILFASAKLEVGISDLVHILSEEAPSPISGRSRTLKRGDELVPVRCDVEAPFLAHVFKVSSDAHLGQVALIRVLQGKIDPETPFLYGEDRKVRKASHIFKIEGREHPEIDQSAWAGDIVALGRVDDIHVDQLLRSAAADADLIAVPRSYPTPMFSVAVSTSNRNDDVKLGQSLQRLSEEDPTFKFQHDPTTRELVVSGLGEIHVHVMLERLKNRFKLDVTSKAPTVPYRETIALKAEGHCRHKKQTGGAGQFAEVFLRIEPVPRGQGNSFKSEVFGGAIPTQYIAAVEKGVEDALETGVLAGFPVHDVRVIATDGKSHPVDSKDIAFRTAGKMAVRDALAKARPMLLEPIVALEIHVPEQFMGAVTGDLKQFRAKIMGMESAPQGNSIVRAVAPLAELSNYGAHLRGATGGQGSFTMELAHYEPMPSNLQQKIIDARPKRNHQAE